MRYPVRRRARILRVWGRPSVPPPTGLADPKDRLAEKRALQLAKGRMLAHNPAGALVRLDAVLAGEPDNRLALRRSGAAPHRAGPTARGAF